MGYRCKECNSELYPEKGQKIIVCDTCGFKQTIPDTDDNSAIDEYIEANNLRFQNRFDEALTKYSELIKNHPDHTEAYWCYLLCEFGIEYVSDARLGKRIPTCHRTLNKSIFDHEYYKKLMQIASNEEKVLYEAEAKEIDRLQKEILSLAKNHDNYDIFICYKESDNNQQTLDSKYATNLYKQLKDAGYNTFMAKFSLKHAAGNKYEPYIYAALKSAKVMLVLSSKEEYINSPWVRNEWSRYLNFMLEDLNKTIVPCLIDLIPEQLPLELQPYECLNVKSIDFFSNLCLSLDNKFNVSRAPQRIINQEENISSISSETNNQKENISSISSKTNNKEENSIKTKNKVKEKETTPKTQSDKKRKNKSFKTILILLLIVALGLGVGYAISYNRKHNTDDYQSYLPSVSTNSSSDSVIPIPVMHTVTFETFGGSKVNYCKVLNNEIIEKPLNPTNGDLIFAGWYTDNNCIYKYNFSLKVTKDFTLYAKWVTSDNKPFIITFDTLGGSLVDQQEVVGNSYAFEPIEPTFSGYSFEGWYLDKEYTKPFNFITRINKNLTLYAKWSQIYSYGSKSDYKKSLLDYNPAKPINGISLDDADAMGIFLGLENNNDDVKEINIPANINTLNFDFKEPTYSLNKVNLVIDDREANKDLTIKLNNVNFNLSTNNFISSKSINEFNIKVIFEGNCKIESKNMNDCIETSNVLTKDSFKIIDTPNQNIYIESALDSFVDLKTGNGIDSSNIETLQNRLGANFVKEGQYDAGNSADALCGKNVDLRLLGAKFNITTGNGGIGSQNIIAPHATNSGSSGSCIKSTFTNIYLSKFTAFLLTTGDGANGVDGESYSDVFNQAKNGGNGGNGGNSGYVIMANNITIKYHPNRSDFTSSSFCKAGKAGKVGKGGEPGHDVFNHYGIPGKTGKVGKVLGYANCSFSYAESI